MTRLAFGISLPERPKADFFIGALVALLGICKGKPAGSFTLLRTARSIA
jgi:hypothetical protein